MAVIDRVSAWLPLFSRGVHSGRATVAGLAHHHALDLVQVPLDLKCHETLALVGIPPLCIVQQRSHKLELPRELLTNGRVGKLKSGHIHLGVRDPFSERDQFCPVSHSQLNRQHDDVCTSQHPNAIACSLGSASSFIGEGGQVGRRWISLDR